VPEERRDHDDRPPFEIDRSRIVHSTAFRRLQGKTQVFGMGGSDYFRTRLTHSLETAQIGKGLAIRLKADTDLVEAACLAHDIGHPPFGHAGEKMLQKLMEKPLGSSEVIYGGFEGNAQNLRILRYLEIRSTRYTGLNLTRATLDSLLKYKDPYSKRKKEKFYYDADEELVSFAVKGGSRTEKSFECEIMEWADDIAYSTHDLEDGIKAGWITEEGLNARNNELRERVLKVLSEEYNKDYSASWEAAFDDAKKACRVEGKNELEKKANRKKRIADMIHKFIISTGSALRDIPSPRYRRTLDLDEVTRGRCEIIKKLVWEYVINDEKLATLEKKGTRIVSELFNIFTENGIDENTLKLYPGDFRERIKSADRFERVRLACDYISGMTDSFAMKVYSRLMLPYSGSLFDLL